MKRALVTTTIYPPHNLYQWASTLREGDVIHVAGDAKTPHSQVRAILDAITERYRIETHYHVETEWEVDEAIGWNSIQRRNVAILEAMSDPDVGMITTVDTDNYPYGPDHLKIIETLLTDLTTIPLIATDTGWFNAGRTLDPPVTHRGFPIGRRYDESDIQLSRADVRIGVHASLWFGDPDIDAIERISMGPDFEVQGINAFMPSLYALDRDTWCPFNSQATTFRREMFPLMCVWPHVGRMDDIWASYVARRVMDHLGYHVAYGVPFVRQARHPHDLVRDLRDELSGYQFTDRLTERLEGVNLPDRSGDETPSPDEVIGCLAVIFRQLEDEPYVTTALRRFHEAWIHDVEHALRHDR